MKSSLAIWVLNAYKTRAIDNYNWRAGLFGPRHLIATQSFMLRWKQSSGNCHKNDYNQRYMKNWEQHILDMAHGASSRMLRLIKWWHFSTKFPRMSAARYKLISIVERWHFLFTFHYLKCKPEIWNTFSLQCWFTCKKKSATFGHK